MYRLNSLSLALMLVITVATVVLCTFGVLSLKLDKNQAFARCPNGTHKAPNGNCEAVSSHEGLPRCPNGYHRSPGGNCEAVNSNNSPNSGANFARSNTNNNSFLASGSVSRLASSSSPAIGTNETIPSLCHTNGFLPDSRCTPGETNPSVTQANIKDTICPSGYTRNVRPPVGYTEPLKIKLMKSYGFSGTPSSYELDHLIPLEIGGNPTAVKNLWPEPGYGQDNYHAKDRFENYLHDQICSGSMNLSTAQQEIATDWLSNWIRAGQP
jgi:hypothetical protein